MNALDDYLEAALDGSFVYGGVGGQDCWLFPADWAVARGMPDPAAHWRGRYRTALGAARIIKTNGGDFAFSHARLTDTGWVRTLSPRRGDVGQITALIDANAVRVRLVGAICVGRGCWASLSANHGLIIGRAIPAWCWTPAKKGDIACRKLSPMSPPRSQPGSAARSIPD